MGSNNIVVREYLESLKEDKELDYLFPILLNLMGFRIVATAKEAKGQSQYGKDIVAIGKDINGVKYRYYFELKGYSDKDITEKNFSSNDGVRESIIEAKDTAFKDSSITGFNSLPIKIIFVHNGILKTNIRPTFDGFISREFNDGEFERWDIFHLTDLFSDFFFNEYLLTDEMSLSLFKQTLALLDAPENDFHSFKHLVDLQIDKIGKIKTGRALNKFFATQGLLCNLIFHYSIENDNIEPAKQCITYLLLKTWAWILREKLDNKLAINREFRKLTYIHFNMLDTYFGKTLSTAKLKNGLFCEYAGPFEEVGYPLRCFEYLNYLLYYFQAKSFLSKSDTSINNIYQDAFMYNENKITLINLIEENIGCCRPIMDYHSIAILNVVVFFLKANDLQTADFEFVRYYISKTFKNIFISKKIRNKFPLLSNNEMVLVNAIVDRDESDYEDRSSLLITILFEILAILDASDIYEKYRLEFVDKVNLQTAYPNFTDYDVEQLLFEKHFDKEFYVETHITLNESFKNFQNFIKSRQSEKYNYRTDAAGFPFLRTLAHIYYKNEFFPNHWRNYLNDNSF